MCGFNKASQFRSILAKVLGVLLRSATPVSREDIGHILDCTGDEVEKAIETLSAQGFVIEACKKGYGLILEPFEMLPVRVEARLDAGCLGLPFFHFQEIDSTNIEARKRAEQGLSHGACICAEIQLAGRGRFDRRWVAPKGSSLLFSVLLRPRILISEVFTVTNLMAISVCEAVERLGGPRCDLKWPNDVYLHGRKLAGILTEFTSREDKLEHVVVGTGINVNITEEDISRIDAPAQSLLAVTGRRWDRAVLLAEILRCASSLYEALCSGNKEHLSRLYNERFWLAGKRVRIRDGEDVITGKALGVTMEGELILESSTGERLLIRNGDVSVLGWSQKQ